MARIKAEHAAHGLKFFSTANMRAFRSRICGRVFDNLCFITSEQDRGSYFNGQLVAAWDGQRRYTVRQFNTETYDIDTVSEFGEFATVGEARRFAEQYGKKEHALLDEWKRLKEKHPDAVILFRNGDFYESYMDDAKKASNILNLTLTRHNNLKDPEGKPLAMAGFPFTALDTYLPRLIRAGNRVAITDAPK